MNSEKKPPETDKHELFRRLQDCRGLTVIVDFDETLWLDNSSSSFSGSVFPEFYGFFINKFVRMVFNHLGDKYQVWRDFVRVFMTTVLAPWTWVVWRLTAGARAEKSLNHELLRAIASSGCARLIIISHGFDHVIRPLLSRVKTPHELYCSSCFRFFNLRKVGKLAFLENKLSSDDLRGSVCISDSVDDLALLKAVKYGFLATWDTPEREYYKNVYIPMRYPIACKFKDSSVRKSTFVQQVVKDDLLLVLLAYHFDFLGAMSLILLFISFMCVYDIGYYENDFKATKRETEPSLPAEMEAFRDYKIKGWPWVWALSLAWAAVYPYYPDLNQAFSGWLKWLAVLVMLRLVFYIFNRVKTMTRIYVFPVLHILKTFSFAAVLPILTFGYAALLGQILSTFTAYCTYRFLKTREGVPRLVFRAVVFYMILITGLIARPGNFEAFYGVSSWLIILWITWTGFNQVAALGMTGRVLGLMKKAAGLVRGGGKIK